MLAHKALQWQLSLSSSRAVNISFPAALYDPENLILRHSPKHTYLETSQDTKYPQRIKNGRINE